MATFPSSVISFGSDVVDGVDDVMASHINTPRAEIVAIETYLRSTRFDNNLLACSLTHDESWLGGTATNDVSDDNYGPCVLWNVLNDAGVGAAPDIAGVAGGTADPFTRYLQCTLDATAQVGFVQFLTAQQSKAYRGATVSLSADLWGTGISNVRMAVIYWTGTADSVTSDVVGTWGAGNPTLATNWSYIGTPADIAITTTRARKSVQNLTIPTNAINLAVFIWLPAQEASTDVLNIARVKLEPGAAATDFVARSPDEELARINYFYQVLDASSNTINIGLGTKTSSATIAVTVQTRKMRVAPTVSHNITAYTAGTPGTTTIALLNRITSAFYAITGALTFASIANNKDYITLQATAGTSWDGTIGDLASLRIGPSVLIAADARL
jgi:hypothetical protein